MNLHQAPEMTVEDVSQRNATSMRLHGRWLVLARMLWIALVALILTFFVASLPAFIATLQTACTTAACQALIASENVQQIQAAGLSVSFYTTYIYILFLIFLLAFLTIGAVIFWLRSNDFIALYTSFALVSFGMVFNAGSFVALLPAWWLPIQIVAFLGNITFGTFFYLFPNGRFVPRWTLWLVVGWVIFAFVSVFFPNSSLNNSWFIGLLFVSMLASVLVAQAYRYRRVSSHVERQQTKWVVFGTVAGIAGFILVILLYFDDVLSIFQQNARADLIAGTALNVFVLLIPVSIAFAILRSRLWDIDTIINKALVYGLLTALLGAIYVGLVLGLQALLGELFHQTSAIALVISTVATYALFWPLRSRIQRVIDRRFYRRKYDAARTLAQFSATLRNEVDLATLSEHLLAVVEETMQPASVSLWLRPPERRNHTQEQKAGQRIS